MPLDRERISLLLDYYGNLLTRHQLDIMNQYFNEDYSMNEIAEEYMISKSAVQDLIKNTINKLENYEKEIKSIELDTKIKDILKEMKQENNDILNKYIDKIEKIL